MALNQKPLLVEAGEGFCLYWQDRPLLPTQNPRQRLEDKAKRAEYPPETLVFIPSPLLHYGIQEFLNQAGPEVFGVIYEHEPELRNLNPGPQDPRLYYLKDFSEPAIQDFFRSFPIHRVRRVKSLRLTSGVSLHPEVYTLLEARLEEEVQTFWKNRMTTLRLGTLWVKNLLRNLPRLAESPQLGSFPNPGKPLVIAGAGLSLEPWLPELKKHRGRFTLVCADTALRTFWEAGITPDLVFAVESQIWNLDDFSGLGATRIPLALDLTAHPGTFRSTRGPRYLFTSRFADLNLLTRLEHQGLMPTPLDPWGSVGVTAVAALGVEHPHEVFLLGLDFCYDGSKSHARGTPAHLALLNRTHRFEPPYQSPGIWARTHFTGEEFPGFSDPSLRFYAQRLQYLVRGREHIFDLRGSGWNLGLKTLTLEEWAARLPRPQAPGNLHQAHAFASRSQVKEFLGGEREKLEALRRSFEALNQGLACPELESQCLDLDYLYFSFPDGDQLRMDSSFLSRLKASLSYHLGLVNQVISSL